MHQSFDAQHERRVSLIVHRPRPPAQLGRRRVRRRLLQPAHHLRPVFVEVTCPARQRLNVCSIFPVLFVSSSSRRQRDPSLFLRARTGRHLLPSLPPHRSVTTNATYPKLCRKICNNSRSACSGASDTSGWF